MRTVIEVFVLFCLALAWAYDRGDMWIAGNANGWDFAVQQCTRNMANCVEIPKGKK